MNFSKIPSSSNKRKSTKVVSIKSKNKNLKIGGGNPIIIQSMTNTDTADVIATAIQIKDLFLAGSEIVRITVNNVEAAKAVPEICEYLDKMNIEVPLVGDFHYNGHKLLFDYPDCAKALSKYRINPGNVGFGEKKDLQFAKMIEIACKYLKPVRIGVNWGSLDQSLLSKLMDKNALRNDPKDTKIVMYEALIKSCLESANLAEKLGLSSDSIVLSAKVSDVQDLINVYRELSKNSDYPLHLGLTEAGIGSKGIVASTAAISVLLQEGIGDTLRVSLTPDPNGKRTNEVIVAQEILQTMGIRSFSPLVIACPGCGRTSSTFFQELASQIQKFLRKQMPEWKKTFNGVEEMKVAVMGCIVNGPGESKHANIGISLPGTGEVPIAPVYIDGEKVIILRGKNISESFKKILEEYVEKKYGRKK